MSELLASQVPTGALLTVGEVAELGGVATSAVRFYERQGLITSTRTSGNQRRFADYVPCLVRVARVAQRVGLTVREIHEVFADLPEEPTEREWAAVTDRLVTEAQQRITDLRAVLADLGSPTRLCELPGA